MRVWIVAAMLITLAGCSEDPAGQEIDDGFQDVDPSSGLGAISGVVVNQAIFPIAGATVDVVNSELSAVTDENGAYAFVDLEPGFYVLQVSAPGHESVQSTADVIADKVSKVKSVLQVDLSPVPFYDTTYFQGYMELSDWYGTYLLTVFLGNNALCDCEFEVTPAQNATTFVADAVWDDNLGRDGHRLYWEWESKGGAEYAYGYYSSPMNLHHQRDEYSASVETWVGRMSSDVGVDYQQEFEVFLSTWYVEKAPEGWSYLDTLEG